MTDLFWWNKNTKSGLSGFSCYRFIVSSLLERLTRLPQVTGSDIDCFKRQLKTFLFCVGLY